MSVETKMDERTIKIETGEDSALQGFFKSLDKDIHVNDSVTVIAEIHESTPDEVGTYFVDSQGQYYYQASSGLPPAQVTIETAEAQQEDIVIVENADQEMANGNELKIVFLRESASEDNKRRDSRLYDFNCNEEEIATFSHIDNDAEIVKYPKANNKVTVNMCKFCDYSSPRRYLLTRHMKSHSNDRPHTCQICERGFKTHASLINHINTHTGLKPHVCKHCSSAFNTSGELIRHVRYRHTKEKPHKCTTCDYASVELSKLKRHIRCHTGERPYQCSNCTYASPDTFKLKRHIRVHTGEKPYTCSICAMSFTQSNSLKTHILIHNYAKKPIFQCELCPVTCGRKTDLRIHIQKLHMSNVPIKCKQCPKSFPDRYTYKNHIKKHIGEKCYKCKICPYAASTQRRLYSHHFVHTDEKPFKCAQCEQCFRQKQLLRRHDNLYHNSEYVPPKPKKKNHECSLCARAFVHKGSLINHMAIHDPAFMDIINVDKNHAKEKQHEEITEEVSDEQEEQEEYEVLELIKLEDEDGEEDELAVAPKAGVKPKLCNEVKLAACPRKIRVPKVEIEDEVKTCFGFEEEGED